MKTHHLKILIVVINCFLIIGVSLFIQHGVTPLQDKPPPAIAVIDQWEEMGVFTVSAYSKERYPGLTRTETKGTPYLTAAIPSDSYSFLQQGDKIRLGINPCGKCHSWFGEFIIEDTGPFRIKGRDLDIMVETETQAKAWGIKRIRVWREK